jgi:hypothetical protein
LQIMKEKNKKMNKMEACNIDLIDEGDDASA